MLKKGEKMKNFSLILVFLTCLVFLPACEKEEPETVPVQNTGSQDTGSDPVSQNIFLEFQVVLPEKSMDSQSQSSNANPSRSSLSQQTPNKEPNVWSSTKNPVPMVMPVFPSSNTIPPVFSPIDPDINIKDKNGLTKLHRASLSKERFRNLLKQGADPNIQDPEGKTVLMKVAKKGEKDIVLLLLAYGADPNIQDNKGRTALMEIADCWTCEDKDKEDIIKILLKNEADPNIQNNEGRTAFMGLYKNKSLLQTFFKYEADPNIQDNWGWTLLIRATEAKDEDLIHFYLGHGAKPKGTKDILNKGPTALMEVAKDGNEQLVKLFLEKGAEPNIQDRKGFTALIYTIMFADPSGEDTNEDIVRLLLASGANPNLQTEDGYTALFVAAGQGHEKISDVVATLSGYEGIVKLLLANGAKPDLSDIYGTTPLSLAVNRGYIQIIEDLLAYEANPNLARIRLSRGVLETLQILIRYGADPNTTDKYGQTVLMREAERCDIENVTFLLENEADPNIQNQTDYLTTALMEAVVKTKYKYFDKARHRDCVSVVNILLEYGADPTIETKQGQTAFTLTDDQEVLTLLEKAKEKLNAQN